MSLIEEKTEVVREVCHERTYIGTLKMNNFIGSNLKNKGNVEVFPKSEHELAEECLEPWKYVCSIPGKGVR